VRDAANGDAVKVEFHVKRVFVETTLSAQPSTARQSGGQHQPEQAPAITVVHRGVFVVGNYELLKPVTWRGVT
jgi:hypothetical protein